MKKVIVTTTINDVTEGIDRFQNLEDWTLIVVGDRKTPSDYKLKKGIYVSPEMQDEFDRSLSEAIGWNCIQRRNFGLLWAHEMEADIVALIDDDNIPYDNWGSDLMVGQAVECNYYYTDLPVFDPVGATNEKNIWHRGYPLQLLPKRDYSNIKRKSIIPQIQADFWNGAPDVDAICRMEHAPECDFDPSYFPMASIKMSPFNSQNTFISAEILKDYFVFPHIGRMDDIWASYYVQSKGYKVVYSKPSVYQKRNEHNLVGDMKKEYLGYEYNLNLTMDLNSDSEKIMQYLPSRSVEAFQIYRRHF